MPAEQRRVLLVHALEEVGVDLEDPGDRARSGLIPNAWAAATIFSAFPGEVLQVGEVHASTLNPLVEHSLSLHPRGRALVRLLLNEGGDREQGHELEVLTARPVYRSENPVSDPPLETSLQRSAPSARRALSLSASGLDSA